MMASLKEMDPLEEQLDHSPRSHDGSEAPHAKADTVRVVACSGSFTPPYNHVSHLNPTLASFTTPFKLQLPNFNSHKLANCSLF
jgi:hypothetical protein